MRERETEGMSQVNLRDISTRAEELQRQYQDRLFEFERRENELLRRELEIARREIELLRQTPPPRTERAHGRESINAMLELVSFFDGSAGTFRKWEQQIRQLCKVLPTTIVPNYF